MRRVSLRERGPLLTAAVLLSLATLVLDLLLPLGVVDAIPYVLVVLLGLWAPWHAFAPLAALAASVLAVIGALLSPPGGVLWMDVLNRLLSLSTVWLAALLVLRHRNAQEALARAERRLSAVVTEAPVVLWASDRAGRLTLLEGRALEQRGLSPSARVGASALGVQQDVPWSEAELRRALAGETHSALHPLGSGWFESRYQPVRDAGGEVEGVIGISFDVTEQRRAEETLRQQEALARLGEMAAVVAHEVRNPLAGIAGAVQVIGQRLPAGSPEQAAVGGVLDRIARLNQLTQELLVFARPRPPKLDRLSLREVLLDAAALLRGDAETAAVAVEIEGQDSAILGDARLLTESFFNLFLNAAQAMSGQGTVRVRLWEEGGLCQVAVADAGAGVPADALPRAFEPFFTTKHRGTGLGLPVVKRSIEAHGGQVRLECPVTGGTTVTVSLPPAARRTSGG